MKHTTCLNRCTHQVSKDFCILALSCLIISYYFVLCMTDQELRDLVSSLAEQTTRFREMQIEAEAIMVEERRKTEEERRKTEEERRKTELALRELGKQIGGLANKFGSFTEGLALPSVQHLLFERFGVEDFMPRRRKRFAGETLELDALGIVNGNRNEAYIVEIKSHLRTEAIEQLKSILAKFRTAFPEYKTMKLYGLIAATDASDDALREAQEAGFYVLTFEEDLMRFHDEHGFTARAY